MNPNVNNTPPHRSDAGRRAFTLIELLTVMSIIAILAALIIPVLGRFNRTKFINAATGELAQLSTAIENYRSTYGFYPPCNSLTPPNPNLNQLYYELVGTTYDANKQLYTTLDGSSSISAQAVSASFGVNGFMNCTRVNTNNSEDTIFAKDFLPGLSPNRIGIYTNSLYTNVLLVTSVRGPDLAYQPLGIQDLNPFRYNSANPTNNTGTYDLWVDLSISLKINRVSNWTKQVTVH